MPTGESNSGTGNRSGLIFSLLGRLFSTEALTHLYAWMTGATNIVLPKARDPFDDHKTIHAWEDRIAEHLKPGLPRVFAERLLQSWGFEFNHYLREDLAALIKDGTIGALPSDVTSVLLSGRVVGEPGSVQPHLRALIYLGTGERISDVRTEVIRV